MEHGERNKGPRGEWGPQRSTNRRDELQKDTDLPIREGATTEAAE